MRYYSDPEHLILLVMRDSQPSKDDLVVSDEFGAPFRRHGRLLGLLCRSQLTNESPVPVLALPQTPPLCGFVQPCSSSVPHTCLPEKSSKPSSRGSPTTPPRAKHHETFHHQSPKRRLPPFLPTIPVADRPFRPCLPPTKPVTTSNNPSPNSSSTRRKESSARSVYTSSTAVHL